jgi:hypothetical protein
MGWEVTSADAACTWGSRIICPCAPPPGASLTSSTHQSTQAPHLRPPAHPAHPHAHHQISHAHQHPQASAGRMSTPSPLNPSPFANLLIARIPQSKQQDGVHTRTVVCLGARTCSRAHRWYLGPCARIAPPKLHRHRTLTSSVIIR